MARELYQLPSTGSIVGTGGGWATYQDSIYTEGARQTISATTRTSYAVNGLGATTNTDYLRTVGAGIWDGVTLQPFAVGEAYSLRIDFSAAPTQVGDGYLELELDIGSGSEINILERRLSFSKGSGVTHNFSAGFPIFCLGTFNTNGGKFWLTPSINCEVWNRRIFIQRTFNP